MGSGYCVAVATALPKRWVAGQEQQGRRLGPRQARHGRSGANPYGDTARAAAYHAALDLKDGAKDFTIAHLVRAVTAGEFTYPSSSARTCTTPRPQGARLT